MGIVYASGGGVLPDLDWLALEGVSSLPTIAMDFYNGRYYGATVANSISKVGPSGSALDRSGASVPFDANAPRLTNLGLAFDGSTEALKLTGPLLAAINSGSGTLVVEFDEIVTNSRPIFGSTGGTLFGRGGNGAVIQTFIGASLNAASTGGNGANLDSFSGCAGLRYTASSRSLSFGGGTTIVGDTSGIGDVSTIYVGRNFAGSQTMTGRIRAIFYYQTQLSDAELKAATLKSPSSMLYTVAYGDSLPAGAGATPDVNSSWRYLLNTKYNGRVPQNANLRGDLAVGGTTSSQALSAFSSSTISRKRIQYIWTGDNFPNAAQTISDIQAMVSTIVAAGGKRYLVMLPLQNSANAFGSANYQAILDTKAGLIASIPASNILDVPALLAAGGDGSAADNAAIASGYTPPSLLYDTIHPNNPGQIIVENGVEARLKANGWLI